MHSSQSTPFSVVAASKAVVVMPSTSSLQKMLFSSLNLHIGASLIALIAVQLITSRGSSFIEKGSLTYRVVFVLAFIANLVTVGIPGRFDSLVKTDSDGKQVYPLGETLFAPAGWAFAIWGAVYLSELLLTLQVAIIGKPMEILKAITPYWTAGQLFQSLWCFVFRPKFKEALWLPTLHLALGSLSLLTAHQMITTSIYPWSPLMDKVALIAIRSPIAIHGTWLAAASLLNLNGWISNSNTSITTQTTVAFFSAYAAALIGAVVSFKTGDPLVAGTVAWALAALSAKTKEGSRVDVATDIYESLAFTEKVLSNVMIVTAIASPALSKIF